MNYVLFFFYSKNHLPGMLCNTYTLSSFLVHEPLCYNFFEKVSIYPLLVYRGSKFFRYYTYLNLCTYAFVTFFFSFVEHQVLIENLADQPTYLAARITFFFFTFLDRIAFSWLIAIEKFIWLTREMINPSNEKYLIKYRIVLWWFCERISFFLLLVQVWCSI